MILHRSTVRLSALAVAMMAAACPQLLEDPFDKVSSIRIQGGAAGSDDASVPVASGGAQAVDASASVGDNAEEGQAGVGGASGSPPWTAGGASGSPEEGGAAGSRAPGGTCSDGILNQDETDIDCGGADCIPCPLCEAAFEPAERIVVLELGEGLELFNPTLSTDGLTLLFEARSGGSACIHQAHRIEGSLVFTQPTEVLQSPAGEDGSPHLGYDRQSLYFHSARPGGAGSRDLWRATRGSPNELFGSPTWLANINSPGLDDQAWLTQDELTIYFVSQRPGAGGSTDLWRAERKSLDEEFGMAVPVTELNSNARDERLTMTADGRVAYFGSDRDSGQGGLDLWFAERSDALGVFESPTNLEQLNTSADEAGVALSADNTELFFASNRDGPSWIWRAVRHCE